MPAFDPADVRRSRQNARKRPPEGTLFHWDRLIAHLRLARAMADSEAGLGHVRDQVDECLDRMLALLPPLREWAAALEPAVHLAVHALGTALEDCRAHDGTPASEVSRAVDRVVHRSGAVRDGVIDRLRSLRHDLMNRAEALRAESVFRRSLRLAIVAAGRTGVECDWQAALRPMRSQPAPTSAEIGRFIARLSVTEPKRRTLRQDASPADAVVLVEDDPHQMALLRWAVDVATAGRIPVAVHGFGNVEDADRFLQAVGNDRRLLLVTDLGLPPRSDGSIPAHEDHGRALVSRWAPLHRTIVVTAHSRLYDEFQAVPGWKGPGGPDSFVPKRPRWHEEVAAVLHRALHPTPLAEASLDVLTFTGSVVLVDGIPVILTPSQFWLLDVLAREESLPPGLERFAPTSSPGHLPVAKTLKDIGLSFIMSSVLPLPDDTDAFWEKLERNHQKQMAGLSRRVEDVLAAAGASYSGPLVQGDDDRDRIRDWRLKRYRLRCQQVRRWVTLTEYGAHRPTERDFRVLVVAGDPEWRAHLAGELADTLAPRVWQASDVEDALATARACRPHAVVLDLELGDDRREGRLSGLGLRESLIRELGPIPMACRTEILDGRIRRRLLRVTDREARPGSEQQERSLEIIRTRGLPDEDVDRIVRFLLECRNARRRNRLLAEGAAGSYHRVRVSRSGPPRFMVDGHEIDLLPPVSRSHPEAVLAHAVLLALAEADNIWMERRAILSRLVLLGRLLPAGTGVTQKVTRAILALRKGLELLPGGPCAAEVIEGKNPYRVRGHVDVEEECP